MAGRGDDWVNMPGYSGPTRNFVSDKQRRYYFANLDRLTKEREQARSGGGAGTGTYSGQHFQNQDSVERLAATPTAGPVVDPYKLFAEVLCKVVTGLVDYATSAPADEVIQPRSEAVSPADAETNVADHGGALAVSAGASNLAPSQPMNHGSRGESKTKWSFMMKWCSAWR